MSAIVLMIGLALGNVSPAADSAQLLRIERQWRDARIKGDTAFLESFYAPDAVFQTMDGGVNRREQDIAMFRSGDMKPEMIDAVEIGARVYGDAAVVTGLDHIRGCYKTSCREMWLRFTDVLIRRDGAWRLVSRQSTPAERPAAAR